jgi:hypothetical protein
MLSRLQRNNLSLEARGFRPDVGVRLSLHGNGDARRRSDAGNAITHLVMVDNHFRKSSIMK